MTPSDVFSMANGLAFSMWLLMIILPHWKVTLKLIDLKIVPLLLSIIYLIYLINSIITGPAMDFGSLQAVMELFNAENAVLAGWLHYLAFDMLIGMWMLEQNKRLKIHNAIMIPVLLATFMMGPIGFIFYMAVRSIKTRNSATN